VLFHPSCIHAIYTIYACFICSSSTETTVTATSLLSHAASVSSYFFTASVKSSGKSTVPARPTSMKWNTAKAPTAHAHQSNGEALSGKKQRLFLGKLSNIEES